MADQKQIRDEVDILKENASLKDQLTKLAADNEAFSKLLDESNKLALGRQDEITSLTAKVAEHETAIAALTETVKTKDAAITELTEKNTALETAEKDLTKRVAVEVSKLGFGKPVPAPTASQLTGVGDQPKQQTEEPKGLARLLAAFKRDPLK